ncbi:MAG: hypothetical protein GXO74_02625 [Calditrichaeota bacterium]|nr:hypothetical protein [Calditrichota bacterium]
MNSRFRRIASIFVLFFLLAQLSLIAGEKSQGLDCFSILVGKNASADGAVLFAHNEDDGGTQIVNLYRVPRQKNEAGKAIALKNGGLLPRPAETNSYLWLQMPKMMFSDGYFNEYGVVIASDACQSREDKPELTDGGITYWLRRAVAEQAHSAREAVHIAGKLVETYGYASSGRTYVIADANEGWMFSAVNGKHWVAARVPDNEVAVLPNYYTIGEVDLSDTTNFLGAKDLIDYAIQRGWYDPARDGKFHFARVYSNPRNLNHPGNINRMWRGVCLVSGREFKLDDELPFSLKPNKKLTPQDLMRVLRDHYEGTELDNTDNYKAGSPYKLNRSTICANSTQCSFVAQLRGWMPKELGCVLWLALRRPDSHAFVPLYLGTQKIPDGFAYDDWQISLSHHFNPPDFYYEKRDDHAFWAHWKLANWVDQDYGNRIFKVQKVWQKFEKSAFEMQPGFEKKMEKIFKKDKQDALRLITNYSDDWLIKSWKKSAALVPKNE